MGHQCNFPERRGNDYSVSQIQHRSLDNMADSHAFRDDIGFERLVFLWKYTSILKTPCQTFVNMEHYSNLINFGLSSK